MPQQALLPVMVWIHGGAYMTGESNEYTGDTLVQASNLSVIVVTINYRLNVFGFLGSADLQKRSADGTTGNFGLCPSPPPPPPFFSLHFTRHTAVCLDKFVQLRRITSRLINMLVNRHYI